VLEEANLSNINYLAALPNVRGVTGLCNGRVGGVQGVGIIVAASVPSSRSSLSKSSSDNREVTSCAAMSTALGW
jgi:hypothetical protein